MSSTSQEDSNIPENNELETVAPIKDIAKIRLGFVNFDLFKPFISLARVKDICLRRQNKDFVINKTIRH